MDPARRAEINRTLAFSVALTILILGLASYPATAQIPSSEREALIRFYQATGGPDWTRNDRWLSNPGTECTWYGITCGGPADDRYVLRIHLGLNNLAGQLPETLAELDRLITLGLSSNRLSGEFHPLLWNLASLEHLNLADNDLTGTLSGAILHWPLTGIDVSGNLLESYGPAAAIATDAESSLTANLADNRFTAPPPPDWGNRGRIKSLDLSGNDFSGVLDIGDTHWPWPTWPNLEALTVRGSALVEVNGIAGANIPGLKALDLSGNMLEHWPIQDASLTRLERLDLSDNRLTELPGILPELAVLHTLDLGDNRLGGELPEWFADLALFNLGLDNNRLSGPIARVFDAIDLDAGPVTGPHGDLGFRLHAANNLLSGALPVLDYSHFNTPRGGQSPEFGLNLCFNDIEVSGSGQLAVIDSIHEGGDLASCLDRPRATVDPSLSGTWYDPARSGEGITQMLLSGGNVLSFWFTYRPSPPSSLGYTGQMWLYGVSTHGGDVWREARPLLETTGGRFGLGLQTGSETAQRTTTRMRQDRLDGDRVHLNYNLLDGAICHSFGCFYNLHAGRHDLTRLTRLAGTTCGSRQPHEWISGVWYDPARSGEGFVVEVIEDGRGVVYWFTYRPDDSGRQAWMMGDGDFDGNTLLIDNLIQPDGPLFGLDYDRDDLEITHWGNIAMTFHDGERGHVYWDSVFPAYGRGDYAIRRLARPQLAECPDD